jgi:hypothetical protein
MKKLFALAAFLLASTAAQAQYTFEYGGRTIRIDPDRGTVSIPGVYDNSGQRTKRSRIDQDSDLSRKQTPEQAKIEPQAPAAGPAPADQVPAPANAQPGPSTATANATSADNAAPAQPPASAPGAARATGRCSRCQARAAPCCRDDDAGATAPRSASSGGEFPARRVADRRKGRQDPDRAMRRQSLRIFGGLEIEPERRTGSDQYEARQGLQMARANFRPEVRQHI